MQYEKKIKSYKRKYKEGFLTEEVHEILDELGIERQLFWGILGNHTAPMVESECLLYPHDLLKGVRIVLAAGTTYLGEFD